MPSDAKTALALYVSLIAGSVVLVLVALHAYASWTIRHIDRRDTH